MKFLQLVIRPGDGGSMWGAGVRLGTIKWTVGQEETQVSKGMSVSVRDTQEKPLFSPQQSTSRHGEVWSSVMETGPWSA